MFSYTQEKLTLIIKLPTYKCINYKYWIAKIYFQKPHSLKVKKIKPTQQSVLFKFQL